MQQARDVIAASIALALWIAAVAITTSWTENNYGINTGFCVFIGCFIITALIASFVWAWRSTR